MNVETFGMLDAKYICVELQIISSRFENAATWFKFCGNCNPFLTYWLTIFLRQQRRHGTFFSQQLRFEGIYHHSITLIYADL